MLQSKTKRVVEEFHVLKRKNPPLAQIILDLVDFARVEFRKDVMKAISHSSPKTITFPPPWHFSL